MGAVADHSAAAAAAAAAASKLLALFLLHPLLHMTLQLLLLPEPVRCRQCPLNELEGIRKDCFYDFEAELAEVPSRSFHVMMQEKCNDTMLAAYPVMEDCVTSRIERHGCSNGATVMRRYRLVRKAHEHLCSARRRGHFCRELPKNLPHYVNLCIESLFDGITSQSAMCSDGVNRRSQMTVQKSQSCVQYILNLMGSQCYFLQFNFYHIRTFAESLSDDLCKDAARFRLGSPVLLFVAILTVVSAAGMPCNTDF